MSKSLYDTLEVSQDANAEEIKKSYRRLARKYHPDINKEAGAEEKFKEINAAYEILSDPEKRKQYDQLGDTMFGGQNFSDFARANVNLDDILSSIFGGRGGFAGGFGSRGFAGGAFGGGFGAFDDRGFSRASSQNLDLKATLTIPFATAIKGGKVSVNLNNQTCDIKIPEGVKNGEVLRAKGKGRSAGGVVGDALLTISIAPHPSYVRDGDDLITDIDIPLKTALFGGKINTNIITKDEPISLKIPKNSKNGQKFRLKGMGVKNRKSGNVGDLYLRANIVLPNVDSLPESLQKSLEENLPE